MIQEIVKAFSLIFVAEMGDKTQILAMAFATQYPILKVLTGIGIGAFLNHGLAVILGALLSTVIDFDLMQMIAGIAFVGFGLWTLKIEDEEDEETSKKQFGPVITVSIAFFIGELGDKTQLTAITLASEASYPAFILLGTVLGMIATGALGIYVGKKLGDKIPELAIKYLASSIFLLFGFQKLYSQLDLIPLLIILGLGLVTAGTMAIKLYKHHQLVVSQFRLASQKLYNYYQHASHHLDSICMGEHYCNACLGKDCAIGHAKEILKESLNNADEIDETPISKHHYAFKPFDKDEVLHVLADTLLVLEEVNDEKRNRNAQMVRQQLEMILIDTTLDYENLNIYLKNFSEHDEYLGLKLRGQVAKLQK